MNKLIGSLFVILFITLSACQKEEESNVDNAKTKQPVAFTIGLTHYGNPVDLNQEFVTANNFKVKLTSFKLYLSDITLQKEDGTNVALKDVILYDLNEVYQVVADIPVGNYTGISYNIGLSPELNNSDPTTFDIDNPLSNYQGMYWSMLKYRFAVVEGTANTASGDPSTMVSFSYHTGTDAALRPFTSTNTFEVQENSNLELVFTVDLNSLFAGNGGEINPTIETSTHSMPSDMALTNKVMDNLHTSMSVQAFYTAP